MSLQFYSKCNSVYTFEIACAWNDTHVISSAFTSSSLCVPTEIEFQDAKMKYVWYGYGHKCTMYQSEENDVKAAFSHYNIAHSHFENCIYTGHSIVCCVYCSEVNSMRIFICKVCNSQNKVQNRKTSIWMSTIEWINASAWQESDIFLRYVDETAT